MGSFGGAETNIFATATELRDRGHTVGLLHGASTGRGEKEWKELFGERFALNADTKNATEAALTVFQPDVAFVHKMADAAVLQALGLSKVPVVRMVHDHDLCCMRGYKYSVLSRKICTRSASLFCVFPCGAAVVRDRSGKFPLRWVSYWAKRREIALNRRFSRHIVATGYMRDELVRNGFSADQIEVHAPVPRAAAPKDTASFGDNNRIVYAGQIVRGKGVDVLLQTLARVPGHYECFIIGDGSHRAACERLCDELDLRAKVHFTGFLPQAQIAKFYREASLAVMSSLWPEPFGATGLEAMRCGLPVVAFDAGGIREWLIDGVNGYLIPWMDRETYADRVTDLLRDKSLARQLGENGRRLAEERFGFSTYIDGLEDLFARTANLQPRALIFQ